MNKEIIKQIGKYALVALLLAGCQTSKPTANVKTVVGDVTEADSLISAQESEEKPKEDKNEKGAPPIWAAKKYQYNPAETRKNDLVHTRLDVRFDWAKEQLNGVATLTLKPYFYPQNTLELDAKGFDIHSVKLVEEKSKKSTELKYTYDEKVITIELNKTYTRDEKYIVRIDYTAKPNELAHGGSAAISNDKGLYFINASGADPNKPKQIWTQGETEASSCWFPTIDTPNQKTTEEIYMTVDAKYTTLSNGLLVYSKTNEDGTRTDYWKMDQPHSPYLFMMAVGEYAVVKDKWNKMEVSYYVEPKFEKYARNIFGNTPEMLEFFSTKLGLKYPWDKYSQIVVRDYVSGAMENTTATIHMEALQVDDRTLLDESWDYIIAHELFHHWFGDLVTAESWANLPLNESFANYSEYLWNEHKYGKDEADYKGLDEKEQYLAESEQKQEPLIRYYYKDREDMFDSHSYAKGGRILHMLRKYVGDDAFFLSLKKYLEAHKYKNAEIHDLRLAFEDVTGEDLNWFFNQWFLSAGHPQLLVTQSYADGNVQLTITQQQDSLYTPIYKLPLKVDVWTAGKKTRYNVVVDKATQTLEFPSASQPDLVVFDAEQQLLGVIKHEKSNKELIFQYYNTDTYLTKRESIKSLEKKLDDPAISKMILDAMDDKFWKVRQLAVAAFGEFKGERPAPLKDKLMSLATKDKRSYVRAESMGVLATSAERDQYLELYRKGIEDPSYTVVATALYAYLATKPTDAATQLSRFEKFENQEIALTIASYYAETGDAEKYTWFTDKISHLAGGGLYQFLQPFGQYLMKANPETQKKGAQVLSKIALENGTYYIRFAAYQALSLIPDAEGVKEIRKEVKEKEKDERLKKVYDMMP